MRLTPVRRDVQSAEKRLGVRCRGAGNLYSAVQRQRKSKCRGHSGHEGRKNLNVKSLSEALLCKKMETKKNWHKIGMKVPIVLCEFEYFVRITQLVLRKADVGLYFIFPQIRGRGGGEGAADTKNNKRDKTSLLSASQLSHLFWVVIYTDRSLQ